MSRVYSIEGAKYPSVTSILSVIGKPALGIWQTNQALHCVKEKLKTKFNNDQTIQETITNKEWITELINEAKKYPQEQTTKFASIGTRAHSIFESLCCGEDVDVENELIPLVNGFKMWQNDNPDIHIIEIEKVLYSSKYGYAGTVDAIGIKNTKDNPGIVVLDWKTSNSVYNDYALQLSAYAKAWEEMNNKPGSIVEAQIVRFDKYKPNYEVKIVNCLEETFEIFINCLHLYNGKKKNLFKQKE